MSNIAGVALITASLFLLVVAVLLNSPHLFYMSTAMVVTILAARLQAWISVRGLSFRRHVPPVATVGEWVTVEITAESSQRIRRPLMSVFDHLPRVLVNETITPSTPIAPAYGEPVTTRYKFIPKRRGVFQWSKLSVIGHDALGIVSLVREEEANPVELAVLPAPIPVPFDTASAAGWGTQETEHGRSRGTGIEPRGIREYMQGDSMRYVHWRSTARTGELVVKEFETGANAAVAFMIQRTVGSDVGVEHRTTLELICGHLAHICGRALRQGVLVQFPALESDTGAILPHEREQQVLRYLAHTQATESASLSEEIARHESNLVPGASLHLCVSIVDPGLPNTIDHLRRKGFAVVAMAYDAHAFLPKNRRGASVQSATETRFLDALRSAGASVRIMPLDGLGK